MAVERSIEDIKHELEQEIRRHLEDNVLGVMTPDEVIVKGIEFIESHYNDMLPIGFEAKLVNPRVEGTLFVADGVQIVRRDGN